jgi:hypothetical protein
MKITKNDILKLERKPVVAECREFIDSNGQNRGQCAKIDCNLCSVYINPAVKWKDGLFSHCPLATHYVNENSQSTQKVRVGQQKQKKR